MHSTILTDAFVDFMNARHEVSNCYYLRDLGRKISDGRLAKLDWKSKHAFDRLVESTRSVARFAQCDGAVVISRSLEALGFGAEIAIEHRKGTRVFDVAHEARRKHRSLDVEQFGMRHRSAIKFVGHCEGAVALVASQDGPVSGIWADGGRVYVKRGLQLVNANLPWA